MHPRHPFRNIRNIFLSSVFLVSAGACASTSGADEEPAPPPPYTDPWEGVPEPGVDEDPAEQEPEPDPDHPMEVEPLEGP